jgi:hypothetical protein
MIVASFKICELSRLKLLILHCFFATIAGNHLRGGLLKKIGEFLCMKSTNKKE